MYRSSDCYRYVTVSMYCMRWYAQCYVSCCSLCRCKHPPSNSVYDEYSSGSGSGGVTMENMTNNPSYTTSQEAITSFTTGTPTDHDK